MAINVDEALELKATFTEDGAKSDPTTPVEFWVLTPGGTTKGPLTASKESTGVYTYIYTPSEAGRHYFQAESSGSKKGIEWTSFDVSSNKITT